MLSKRLSPWQLLALLPLLIVGCFASLAVGRTLANQLGLVLVSRSSTPQPSTAAFVSKGGASLTLSTSKSTPSAPTPPSAPQVVPAVVHTAPPVSAGNGPPKHGDDAAPKHGKDNGHGKGPGHD